MSTPTQSGASQGLWRIRRSHERGHAHHGWLETHHTFSFANYQDPRHMGFRTLRVINDDRIAPGQGFPTHPHRDMEILTYVLDGELAHRDSLGHGSVVRPGEVQRMSAGHGVVHSEFNHSDTDPLHLLQIWILPAKKGLQPSYEQKAFPIRDNPGQLILVASPDGANQSLTLHQDVRFYASRFRRGDTAVHVLEPNRHTWLHVARGRLYANGLTLGEGDGLACSDSAAIEIEGLDDAEFLLFDLA